MPTEKNNKDYMKLALQKAEKALKKEEIPIGCIIVDNTTNKILAKTHNTVETNKNPTHHAEINAITTATKKLKTKFLTDCTLYTTLEPCAMCATAISYARIPTIVIAAIDKKAGAVLNNIKIYDQTLPLFKPKVLIIPDNELQTQSSEKIKTFFKKMRKEKKALKTK